MSDPVKTPLMLADELIARMEAGWKLSDKPGFDNLRAQLSRMFEQNWAGHNKWGYTMLDWWMLNYAESALITQDLRDEVSTLKLELQRAKVELARYAYQAELDNLTRMENPYGY